MIAIVLTLSRRLRSLISYWLLPSTIYYIRGLPLQYKCEHQGIYSSSKPASKSKCSLKVAFDYCPHNSEHTAKQQKSEIDPENIHVVWALVDMKIPNQRLRRRSHPAKCYSWPSWEPSASRTDSGLVMGTPCSGGRGAQELERRLLKGMGHRSSVLRQPQTWVGMHMV